MPCTDVTENLRLVLDHEDRITDYELSKQTCGGAVAGRGLIRKWVKHKQVHEVLGLTAPEVLAGSDIKSGTDEYLYLKHLFSIQETLSAFTGAAESDSELLSILAVDHGPENVTIQARINLEALTDRIKACGLCGDSCRIVES
jgi:hypothetical protein